MQLQFTAVFEKVPEGYIGFVEELPGANTQGTTLDEARTNLAERYASCSKPTELSQRKVSVARRSSASRFACPPLEGGATSSDISNHMGDRRDSLTATPKSTAARSGRFSAPRSRPRYSCVGGGCTCICTCPPARRWSKKSRWSGPAVNSREAIQAQQCRSHCGQSLCRSRSR